MSIKVATKIWTLRGFNPAQRLVLVKLADIADDDGVCWPSVPRLAADCELSERTVQAALTWAEKRHLLTRSMREGRSTIYRLTPADFSPPQELHPAIHDNTPAIDDTIPPQSTTPTPAIHDSVVYRTVNREPSLEPSTENHHGCGSKTELEFERFWEAYPRQRRGSHEQALKAWKRALKKTTPEIIHAAVNRYSRSREVTDGYAKGAAAWLNAERYTDEPITHTARAFDGLTGYERGLVGATLGPRGHAGNH